MNLVTKGRFEECGSIKHVVWIEPGIELFYAPDPLAEIEADLRDKAWQSPTARRHLEEIRKGLIPMPRGQRDYRFYADFVEKLANDPLVMHLEQGFFNFYVGPDGLKFIDEKEVDIRLAIRAVDACIGGEADSLCIVSSDQDYIPLHERCARSGVRTYQADVARFAGREKVGRRIRALGAGFIPSGVDPHWALRAIVEAIAPFDIYPLSIDELEGLCQIHNEFNEFKLSPLPLVGGGMGLKMYRPG